LREGRVLSVKEFLGFDSNDTDIGTSCLDHGDKYDGEDPKKRPKWWHNTIGYVRTYEMIEGRSLRNKSNKPNTVNFSLMANVQEVYEP
jgi:hypothetical protein